LTNYGTAFYLYWQIPHVKEAPLTIYADVLFIVNFVMNAFVLYIAGRFVRSPRKKRWVAAGAGVMALAYTIVLSVPWLRGAGIFALQAIILAAGVFVAFYPRRWRNFAVAMLLAYMVTFTVGGLGMALFFLTDLPVAVRYIAADLAGFSRAVSWQVAAAGMALSYGLIKLAQLFLERRALKKQVLCNVQVCMDEEKVEFPALIDTGHSLREPISQAPVIVAEFNRMEAFLPEALRLLFRQKREDNLTGLLLGQSDAFYTRLRMVPFTSIGRSKGMLVGFRPDSVLVADDADSQTRSDVIIGIYNDTLTNDGTYQGLVSAELVN
jgi:stage II sporulation protein GA (sporulation sigma-E factor processing peptidase)